MTPKYAAQAIDSYLRDLMDKPDVPLRGKVVVFGEGFRQVLPIIPNENRRHVIISSFKWHDMIISCIENLTRKLLRLVDGTLSYAKIETANKHISEDLIKFSTMCTVTRKEPSEQLPDASVSKINERV